MNNKFCNVKNRGAGFVTYSIPDEKIRRTFSPGEVKKITYEELEKLTFQPGGMTILTNFLQIQDLDAIDDFNMRVEPEYHMSEADIVKLLREGSLDSFLDALDFAPRAVIDLIKKFSVELPLLDPSKRKALKEKTGFDVEAAIKHKEEDSEDNGTILKTTERRVQPEKTGSTGRRAEAPKYNVVKTAETAE